MDREKYITDGLEYHLQEFKKEYPNLELLCLCLQGSQNYGLDIYEKDYKSDIDTKAIVIPTLEDIVLNRKPISTTYILPNNEHIDIKDIRLMFDTFKKQNTNFIEILFTQYSYVNPEYSDLWFDLIKERESIARLNINQALRCMAGMSMEKKKALCHPYPNIIDKIKKYGYDGKQLHHIIRMNNFIFAYGEYYSFEYCLKYLPNKEDMMKAKRNEFSLEEALYLAKEFDNDTKALKEKYLKPSDRINEFAVDILNKTQYNVIKRKLLNDISLERVI